jgi:hypothetical protein
MTHPYDGIVGTMPRATFEARYQPVPARQARRTDVLMEVCEDDPTRVMLYPTGVRVYPWRTFWRAKAPDATPS